MIWTVDEKELKKLAAKVSKFRGVTGCTIEYNEVTASCEASDLIALLTKLRRWF